MLKTQEEKGEGYIAEVTRLVGVWEGYMSKGREEGGGQGYTAEVQALKSHNEIYQRLLHIRESN